MRFTKMHGAGNDFVLLKAEDIQGQDPAVLAKAMCHRHFGIGADGLMVVFPSDSADVRMEYYNSDGSLAAMCGNGIRCFSKFAHDIGIVTKTEFTVETRAGIKAVRIIGHGSDVRVRVSMGAPELLACEVPAKVDAPRVWAYPVDAAGVSYPIYSVRMGVPHTVVLVDAISAELTESVGPVLEKNRIFPERTNVNFVQVISKEQMKVDTWERGAGHTLACGTGVCASVWIAHELGLTDRTVRVQTPGGELTILLDANEVIMEGGAVKICSGEYFEE